MNEYENPFEKISFWQLLKTCSVEIPIIQRDYAQGRANKKNIRENFLNALYNAIKGNPIELDFVYGSEKNEVLQPLDGQQRLTTLFLLYWYIAVKEGKINEAKELLSKFTYETRTSSREFCKELINGDIVIKDDEQISISIKEKTTWFVASWKKDPTISAMLIMLDAIQGKFKKTGELWEKFTKEENPPITFLYLKLENFGLSDDLYIKMNARGKQLTTFENFKSCFGKYIKKNEWEKTNPEETFVHKIDTVWTDLFWKYKGNDNLIDNKLINFIAGIAINYYAQNLEIQPHTEEETKIKQELIDKNKTKTVSDDAIKRERIEKRLTKLVNKADDITPEDFPSKISFEYLVNCLDKYAKKTTKSVLNINVPLWNYCEKTLFEDLILNDKPRWKERVLFYAQTCYLLSTSFDSNTFDDWMRVVRNIVENSTISTATPFVGAIRLIKELSNGCANIYDYLSKNDVQSDFAKEQVKEEIEKAKIIDFNSSAKKVLHDMEDVNFCKGRIDFALYCADYDITNPQSNKFDKDKLEKIHKVINDYFSGENDTKLPDDFKRAFLTIGSNNYYDVWGRGNWSYSFDCHKRLLLNNIKDLKQYFTIERNWTRDYLKKLFKQLDSKQSFQKIIADYNIPDNMPNWKKRLIKEDGLRRCNIYPYSTR
jgi:hypothetical protein